MVCDPILRILQLRLADGRERHLVSATCTNTAGLDVTSEESVNAFVSEVVSRYGRIDYACNVAGILITGESLDFSAANFDKQFSVNARGMWLCQRAEIAQMVKQEPIKGPDSQWPARGSIVNIASMAGLRGYDGLPSYCESVTTSLRRMDARNETCIIPARHEL